MISLIDVTCPHCAAEGQIMLPPPGAIIIGPCPECDGIVAVFCGRVLALDKDIMTDGTVHERRDHIVDVLSDFVRGRVERLFGADSGIKEHLDSPLGTSGQRPVSAADATDTMKDDHSPLGPISTHELEAFRTIDLRLLDNRDYFDAIFQRGE